jgi:hypothetical protein
MSVPNTVYEAGSITTASKSAKTLYQYSAEPY